MMYVIILLITAYNLTVDASFTTIVLTSFLQAGVWTS